MAIAETNQEVIILQMMEEFFNVKEVKYDHQSNQVTLTDFGVTFKLLSKNGSVMDALRNIINLKHHILDNCKEYQKLKEYRQSFRWLIDGR